MFIEFIIRKKYILGLNLGLSLWIPTLLWNKKKFFKFFKSYYKYQTKHKKRPKRQTHTKLKTEFMKVGRLLNCQIDFGALGKSVGKESSLYTIML